MATPSIPNKNFIQFLQIYGPWAGGSNQFDEHVQNTARKLGVTPFNINLPQQDLYVEQIKKLLDGSDVQIHGHSVAILISGQAGDGKTHFLHRLFQELAGQPYFLSPDKAELKWQELCADDASGEQAFAGCLQFSAGNCDFTVVKDLTEVVEAKPQVNLLLRHELEAILREHEAAPAVTTAASAAATAAPASATAATETAAATPAIPATPSRRKIMLLAGNNGKFLEFCVSSDQSSHSHVFKTLRDHMERHMLMHAPFHAAGVKIFDMSACISVDVIKNIFTTLIDPESAYWQPCKDCALYATCPIVRNCCSLQQTQVLTRFCEICELLKDSGMAFSIRNVLLIIANALLGMTPSISEITTKSGKRSTSKRLDASNYLTCQKVSKDKERILAQRSLPFDNLLGLNLISKPPIFEPLAQMGVGEFSSKLIDNFMLFGEHDSALTGAHQQQLQSQDRFGLYPQVQKLMAQLRDNEQVSDDREQINLEESQTKLQLEQMQQALSSLRRVLFFTMPYNDYSRGDFNLGLFKPYLLTAGKFSAEYLYLKRRLELPEVDLSIDAVAKDLIVGLNRAFTVMMVLKDDDKVFVSTNNKLNPTAYCVIYNKSQFMVSVGGDNASRLEFALSQDMDGIPALIYRYQRKDAQAAPDVNQLMQQLMLMQSQGVFTGVEASALINRLEQQKQQKQQAATPPTQLQPELKLTPKMCEYLLSLAHGVMGLSFSAECNEEINAFKADMDAIITSRLWHKEEAAAQNNHAVLSNETIDKTLSNIIFCDINAAGSIAW